MSFSLINPTGWTTGDLLTDDQINQLDQDHAAAVDGAGGSYSLASPLQFSGSYVQVDALVADTIQTTGNVDIDGDISVNNAGYIGNGLTVTGLIEASESIVAAHNFYAGIDVVADRNISAGNDAAVAGVLTVGGRIIDNHITVSSTAQTVDVLQYPNIRLDPGSATTTTLTAAGVRANDSFSIFNSSGYIQILSGILSMTIPVSTCYRFAYVSGAWTRFA